MIIANVRIGLSCAETTFCAGIPNHAVGLKVRFQYTDPIWKQLSKTAVFRNETTSITTIVTDDCSIIPHELLNKTNDTIYVGLYGTDTNRVLAIPTVWAHLGKVAGAANPSANIASDATLPYWAQIQEKVDSLEMEMMDQEDLNKALNQAKDSGLFDGPAGYSPILGTDYWTEEDKKAVTAEAANMAAKAIQHSSDILCAATGYPLAIADSANRELHGMKLYGKTVQNHIPSVESPVPLKSAGNEDSLTVTIHGANLVDINNITYSSANGGTHSVTGNVITASSKASWGQLETENMSAVPGTVMYLSCKGITGGNNSFIRCCAEDTDGTPTNFGSSLSGAGKIAVTVPDNAVIVRVRMYINGTNSSLNTLVEASFDSVMLSHSDTDYEPYKEIQTLTVQPPNNLPGITVASGGNHTDETGQQWWCDTVNFGTGKYEHRTISATLDGTHPIAAFKASGNTHHRIWFNIGSFKKVTGTDAAHLCTHLSHGSTDGADGWYPTTATDDAPSYIALTLPDAMSGTTKESVCAWLADNPVQVLVGRSDIQYEDLTAEQLAAYAALRTHKPNTTIFNDAGADMEASYVADTKLYIDRKFSELAAAIVNNT